MTSGGIEISFNLVAAIVVIASSLGLTFAFRHELEEILQKVLLKLNIPIGGARKPPPVAACSCLKNPPHSLDPNWEVCPYCEAEQKANQKSRPEIVAPPRRERTIVGEVPAQGGRRETKTMP